MKPDAIRQAFRFGAAPSPADIVGLDIDAEHPRRPEALDQKQVDTPDAAADIENFGPPDLTPAQGGFDLRRSARREKPLTPDELEGGDHGVAVFGGVGRLHG